MSALRTYRNTRTGAFFETPCECAGDDWEEVSPAEPQPEPKPEPEPEPEPEPKPKPEPEPEKAKKTR